MSPFRVLVDYWAIDKVCRLKEIKENYTNSEYGLLDLSEQSEPRLNAFAFVPTNSIKYVSKQNLVVVETMIMYSLILTLRRTIIIPSAKAKVRVHIIF